MSYEKLIPLLVLLQLLAIAQTGSDSFRKVGLMNGNRIKTVFTNYGVLAQPSLNTYPRLAWKYATNGYISDCSPVIGVELPIKDYNGDTVPDTIHSVIVTVVSRPGGGKSSPGEKSWTFEPLPGYFNPAISEDGRGVAMSTQPDTWPTAWPDHPEWGSGVWNGLYGANTYTGIQEAFFKMDDQNDDEMFTKYGFLPNSTDTSRRGCGLEISSRLIQFLGEDFQDVLFRVYDIKNTGTANYQKVVFGNLTGTYIGISGDEWNDDASLFYPKDNIIITSDFDNYVRPSANPKWMGRVGKVGEKFLASPQNNKISSFQYFVPASDIGLADNEEMWKKLRPGYYSNPRSVTMSADSIPIAAHGEDGDYIYGSGYFPLNAKETKRIITAIGYGNTDAEVLMRLKKAEVLANCDFNVAQINSAITVQGLTGNPTLSGTTNITWQAGTECTSVEIWYSPDLGRTWTAITRETPNTGSYSWETTTAQNSPIALLRLFAKKNGVLYGFKDSPRFSVSNGTVNNLFVQIVSNEFDTDSTITANVMPCLLYAASTNSLPLQLKILYALNGTDYYPAQEQNVTNLTEIQQITVHLDKMPNSTTFSLKFLLTNGVDSTFDCTPAFYKQTIQYSVHSGQVQFLNTTPDATVEVKIVDQAALTHHQYRVTFEDTLRYSTKTLSVYDVTTGEYKLKSYIFSNNAETPSFDGMSLYIKDFESCLDSGRSGWNNYRSDNLQIQLSRYRYDLKNIMGLTPPEDYCVVIGNTGSYSSDSLPVSLFGGALPAKAGINFAVSKISRNGDLIPTRFGYVERVDSLSKRLSKLDALYLSNEIGTIASYRFVFNYNDTTTYHVPTPGDTLWVYTKKGLTIFDTLMINNPLAIKDNALKGITSYQLYQNYPNPFNPTTTITYALPEKSQVDLTIYNQLGQRVAVLYSGEKNAGTFSATWNAANYSSGVYFYQLKTDKFSSVKKLILLK